MYSWANYAKIISHRFNKRTIRHITVQIKYLRSVIMVSRAVIKENAKKQLGGNIFSNQWLSALLVYFIMTAVSSASALVLGIGPLIVAGPMMIGMISVLLPLVRGSDRVNIGYMFKNGFSDNFGRNLLVGLLKNIFIALWSLLFVIPGVVKSYSYAMTEYLAWLHPDWDWNVCMNESKRLTKGHKGDLFMLDLSFIGWYLVGSLCLGVGMLWVYPYHEMSKINYYEAILAESEAAGGFGAPNGFNSNGSGFNPAQNGFNPAQNGFNTEQNGFNPTQNGFAPEQGGFNPEQNGFNPGQNGNNL